MRKVNTRVKTKWYNRAWAGYFSLHRAINLFCNVTSSIQIAVAYENNKDLFWDDSFMGSSFILDRGLFGHIFVSRSSGLVSGKVSSFLRLQTWSAFHDQSKSCDPHQGETLLLPPGRGPEKTPGGGWMSPPLPGNRELGMHPGELGSPQRRWHARRDLPKEKDPAFDHPEEEIQVERPAGGCSHRRNRLGGLGETE